MHFTRCASVLFVVLTVVASAVDAQRTLLRESFEETSVVTWQHTWGTAAVGEGQAHTGTRALKCLVENRYGMSVHYCDFPARAGATYTLTGWLFVPAQEKECFPVLRLCTPQWSPTLAEATPTGQPNRWQQLQCRWTNEDNRATLRVALHNAPWKEGLEGARYYWDDIVLTEEGGEMAVSGGRGRNPHVIEGVVVTPAGGMRVRVSAGKVRVGDNPVSIDETVLTLAPAKGLTVRDEPLQLTDEEPQGWGRGTPLAEARSLHTTLKGCLEPGSLVVKREPGPEGEPYKEGVDWRADHDWGRVGRLPEGGIAAGQTVYADYRVRLMRVDTVCVDADGTVFLRQGDSQKMCPQIPVPDHGSVALVNVFVPYGCTELGDRELYPIGESFAGLDVDLLARHRARVAGTRAKLAAGDEVTLVTWGDSVTVGGDATQPKFRFAEAFAQALRFKYPQARVKLINAGRGGWNSNRSLPLFEEDVLQHHPSLVTIEYVNDMGMDEENFRRNYFEALDRLRAIGAEVILITPHFTMPAMMGLEGSLETPETRPQVTWLREIAEEKQVALADASRRWEHLAAEGVPYTILLRNGINHPNDAGHRLFVEELMRLF